MARSRLRLIFGCGIYYLYVKTVHVYLLCIDVAFTAAPNGEHFHWLVICDKPDKANISDNNNDLSLLLVTHKTSIYTHIHYSVTYILISFLLASKGPVNLLFRCVCFFVEARKYTLFYYNQIIIIFNIFVCFVSQLKREIIVL